MSKCEASCLTIRVISPYGNEVSVGPVLSHSPLSPLTS